MFIRYICTNCGRKCKSSEEYAGQKARCFQCGTLLEIPRPENIQPQPFIGTNKVFRRNLCFAVIVLLTVISIFGLFIGVNYENLGTQHSVATMPVPEILEKAANVSLIPVAQYVVTASVVVPVAQYAVKASDVVTVAQYDVVTVAQDKVSIKPVAEYPDKSSNNYSVSPMPWIFTGHVYRLYNELVSWRAARKRCEEMGGHLVLIRK